MYNIPVNTPLLNGNEKKYLNQCIDTGWISSEGPFVGEFEKNFAERFTRKHAISVSNGTAAIDAVIEALKIGEGDEVIMPTFTIISCINQIIRNKAIPVLIDSDPLTWNMDVSQVKSKITSRTKAIMVVHIYGIPVDMEPILALAKQYNIKIIEDAAEMHGQDYKGKPCVSFGDVSVFSFYPNKHITTGEGGMILTDNDEIAEDCRGLRNLCFQEGRRFVHERLGWNLRMTNLQAAVGLAQLERLDEFVIKKRKMGELYTKLLSEIDEIQMPIKETSYSKSIYWVFGIVLKEHSRIDVQYIMNYLNKKGIGTRPFFYPMHLQPALKNLGLFSGESYPVAENLSKNGFYLPSGLGLKDGDVECVCETLKSAIVEFK